MAYSRGDELGATPGLAGVPDLRLGGAADPGRGRARGAVAIPGSRRAARSPGHGGAVQAVAPRRGLDDAEPAGHHAGAGHRLLAGLRVPARLYGVSAVWPPGLELLRPEHALGHAPARLGGEP